MADLLEIRGISASYGPIRALQDVSLAVPEGAVIALLGGNGAGKTTTLNAVSGVVRLSAGEIHFDGRRIDRLSSDEIVGRGLIQVPEGREVFRDLSVRENLELGAYLRRDGAVVKRDLEALLDRLPRLRERLSQKAATLSGGEQQMLAMARALMGRPRLLMLDEPSMGLSPLLVQQIFEMVRQMNREGLSILLVEQNVKLALSVSSHAYILENGELTLQGASQALSADEEVRRSYLGA